MLYADLQQVRCAVEAAISRQEVHAAVGAIYAEVEKELAAIQPRCEMSGRCCRFEGYGHRLFVTTAELATFAAAAGECELALSLLAREDGGGCRFQDMRLCQVHAIRPLGCRLFFCDAAHEQRLQQLFERMHERLKALHDELGVEYLYVEWRQGLEAIVPLISGR